MRPRVMEAMRMMEHMEKRGMGTERGPGPSQPSEEHVHPDSGTRGPEASR